MNLEPDAEIDDAALAECEALLRRLPRPGSSLPRALPPTALPPTTLIIAPQPDSPRRDAPRRSLPSLTALAATALIAGLAGFGLGRWPVSGALPVAPARSAVLPLAPAPAIHRAVLPVDEPWFLPRPRRDNPLGPGPQSVAYAP